jgi:hypothetical protein
MLPLAIDLEHPCPVSVRLSARYRSPEPTVSAFMR